MIPFKNTAYRALEILPEFRSFRTDRWTREAQPSHPKAQVLLTVLTLGGVDGNGKVKGYQYFSRFTQILRGEGYRTHFCFSLREVRRRMRQDLPTILVHVFGEDHYQIMSPEVMDCELKAIAVFNASLTGRLVSDKLLFTQEAAKAGIKVPQIYKQGNKGFIRSRLGTAEDAWVIDEDKISSIENTEDQLITEFIDTRVSYCDREFFTTVRLLCVNNKIVHAFPRCRDAAEGNASVHAVDTPLNPALIEFLDSELIQKNMERFSNITRSLHDVLGHGFYAHDLLIERDTADIFVCESGFKFDAFGYWSHLSEIKDEIPSQAILYPSACFIRKSSFLFLSCCESVLQGGSLGE